MFKVGDKVIFGRVNGEQTLGTVVKINAARCKVRQDDERGTARIRPAGTIWTVPFSLMRLADGTAPAPVKMAPAQVSFRLGDKVSFDARGKTHTGHVTRISVKTISVDAGTGMWRVSPGMLRMADAAAAVAVKRPDGAIMSDILDTYMRLSPENLSCDGERSSSQRRRRGAELATKLIALFAEIGRRVSEEEACRWPKVA